MSWVLKNKDLLLLSYLLFFSFLFRFSIPLRFKFISFWSDFNHLLLIKVRYNSTIMTTSIYATTQLKHLLFAPMHFHCIIYKPFLFFLSLTCTLYFLFHFFLIFVFFLFDFNFHFYGVSKKQKKLLLAKCQK